MLPIDCPILRDASGGSAEWLAEERGKGFVFTLEIPADTSLACTVVKSHLGCVGFNPNPAIELKSPPGLPPKSRSPHSTVDPKVHAPLEPWAKAARLDFWHSMLL
jgi:hypothetical protein